MLSSFTNLGKQERTFLSWKDIVQLGRNPPLRYNCSISREVIANRFWMLSSYFSWKWTAISHGNFKGNYGSRPVLCTYVLSCYSLQNALVGPPQTQHMVTTTIVICQEGHNRWSLKLTDGFDSMVLNIPIFIEQPTRPTFQHRFKLIS